jgi:hypothetical protein
VQALQRALTLSVSAELRELLAQALALEPSVSPAA